MVRWTITPKIEALWFLCLLMQNVVRCNRYSLPVDHVLHMYISAYGTERMTSFYLFDDHQGLGVPQLARWRAWTSRPVLTYSSCPWEPYRRSLDRRPVSCSTDSAGDWMIDRYDRSRRGNLYRQRWIMASDSNRWVSIGAHNYHLTITVYSG